MAWKRKLTGGRGCHCDQDDAVFAPSRHRVPLTPHQYSHWTETCIDKPAIHVCAPGLKSPFRRYNPRATRRTKISGSC